ncbi:amidohydrolase [Catenulispora rubra]|uniref:amidohydrolase n=1 Tax=Catenulispora rubra TaxID=280293 RepID=UPI001892580C|nr:amidohydrolase [Catenulispora rubra]
MLIDVHQHLWSAAFSDALRRRRTAPFLDGWTLHLDGEPPYAVDPAAHDVQARAAAERSAGVGLALVSLSAPLGIEYLPPDEAVALLDAYHVGALESPDPFGVWAAASVVEPDPVDLGARLDAGCVGLQLPATALLGPEGYQVCGSLLSLLEDRGKPLFLHPGPAGAAAGRPGWWPAVVSYVNEMHAAWFAFRAFGRPAHPRLRVCFAMLAGLGPLHGERARARGGPTGVIDPDVFVETSSYGLRATDAVLRVLGVDAIVLGSDRPYAQPITAELSDFFGPAAAKAFTSENPGRLLGSGHHSTQRATAH